MKADQPTLDAIVDAVHRLAQRGTTRPGVDDVASEAGITSPAAAGLLQDPRFPASLGRSSYATGRYLDCQEVPYPILDEFAEDLDQILGVQRAAEIRTTRRLTLDEDNLLTKRWANLCLDKGLGMLFWLIDIRASDGRSAWVLTFDEDDGPAIPMIAATRSEIAGYLSNYGYTDKPVPIA